MKTEFFRKGMSELLANKSLVLGVGNTLSNEAVAAIVDENTDTPLYNKSRLIKLRTNKGIVLSALSAEGKTRNIKSLRKKDGSKNNDYKTAGAFSSFDVSLETFIASTSILADDAFAIKNQFNAEQLIKERMAQDVTEGLEYIGLFSDTDALDDTLAQFDGVVKKATKVYGLEGANDELPDYDKASASAIFKALLGAYDAKYKFTQKMVFYVNTETLENYQDERIAHQAASEIHEAIGNLKYKGIEIVEAPVLNDTDVPAILTHQDNIYFGVNEDEFVAEYREDVTEVTIDSRVHMTAGVEKQGATVVARNVAKV